MPQHHIELKVFSNVRYIPLRSLSGLILMGPMIDYNEDYKGTAKPNVSQWPHSTRSSTNSSPVKLMKIILICLSLWKWL